MLITLIIAIAFVVLLIRAIIESAWGICLIAGGLCLIIFSQFLRTLAWICNTVADGVAILIKIARHFQKEESKKVPERTSVARAIALCYCGNHSDEFEDLGS